MCKVEVITYKVTIITLLLNIPSAKSVLSTLSTTTTTLSVTFLFLSSSVNHNFFISLSNVSTFSLTFKALLISLITFFDYFSSLTLYCLY